VALIVALTRLSWAANRRLPSITIIPRTWRRRETNSVSARAFSSGKGRSSGRAFRKKRYNAGIDCICLGQSTDRSSEVPDLARISDDKR